MDHYTSLITSEVTHLNKLDFLNRIQMNPEELERVLLSIKTRILNEIGRLDGTEFGQIDFSKQMELIYELLDTGFKTEAIACMNIMEIRIGELKPELKPWFQLHKVRMDMPTVKSKHPHIDTEIFIENFDESRGVINVCWCYDGVQNDENPQWHDSVILSSDLLEFAQDLGLPVVDASDHAGEHIQHELRIPIFQHVQENIEGFIKKYIKRGWPRIDLN